MIHARSEKDCELMNEGDNSTYKDIMEGRVKERHTYDERILHTASSNWI